MEKLAAVLPFARVASMIELKGNPRIGQRGWDALAAALEDRAAAPELKIVYFDQFASGAAARLRQVCEERGIGVKAMED